MKMASAHKALENPDILGSVLLYLNATETAMLSAACTATRSYCIANDAVIWGPLYESQWKCAAQKSPYDGACRISTLYARRSLRRTFKNAAFVAVEYGLHAPAVPAVLTSVLRTDAKLETEARHRTRSRGDSIDLVTPEKLAAAEAAQVGALRYVATTRAKIVFGASDQGHIAAWYVPNERPGIQHASIQSDIFATAIGAKARRDAKKKYSGTVTENRLIYFKVHGMSNSEELNLWNDTPAVTAGGKDNKDSINTSNAARSDGMDDEITRTPSPITSGSVSVASCATDSEMSESDLPSDNTSIKTAKRPTSRTGINSTAAASRLSKSPMLKGALAADSSPEVKGRARWSDADRLKLEEREMRRKAKLSSNSSASPTLSPESMVSEGSSPPPSITLGDPATPLMDARDSPIAPSSHSIGTRSPPPIPSAGRSKVARVHGSKLRSDVWFACHWFREEPTIDEAATAVGKKGDSWKSPKPVSSGCAVTFRMAVAFPDGEFGILVPGAVSIKATDRVYSVGRKGGLHEHTATQLLPVTTSKRAMVPLTAPWVHGSVVWLARPTGETRDPVKCVRCFPGKTMPPKLDEEPSSSMTPDVIVACFGRAVGVWLYFPHASELQSSSGTPSGGATKDVEDMDSYLQPSAVLRGHAVVTTATAVHSTSCSPRNLSAFMDGVTVVSADESGEIALWKVSSMRKIAALSLAGRGVREPVTLLEMDVNVIVAGGALGTVAIWRRRTGSDGELPPELIAREQNAHTVVRYLALPPTDSSIAAVVSGGGEGDLKIWSTAKFTSRTASTRMQVAGLSASAVTDTAVSAVCKLLRGHSSRITGVHIDDYRIISISLDGTLKIWDLQEPHVGRVLQTVHLPHEASSLHCQGNTIMPVCLGSPAVRFGGIDTSMRAQASKDPEVAARPLHAMLSQSAQRIDQPALSIADLRAAYLPH